jgi:hypothetical protein
MGRRDRGRGCGRRAGAGAAMLDLHAHRRLRAHPPLRSGSACSPCTSSLSSTSSRTHSAERNSHISSRIFSPAGSRPRQPAGRQMRRVQVAHRGCCLTGEGKMYLNASTEKFVRTHYWRSDTYAALPLRRRWRHERWCVRRLTIYPYARFSPPATHVPNPGTNVML